ncbi:polyprenyl synthetase family protein [Methylobacillus gramineus]|uniref:polyprenyl synthetase family protein n=1 Tax=Methylobacillus gramineus TaxID=755169 RepID=UPI001D001445|nr:farnesyl diphosphate synthase [Methylobacillus gramineus]MCB5186340.1 polyprenyl synthetase family protein [Methylobacillus gramineus]
MTDFQSWARHTQQRMEQVLDTLLPPADIAPQKLHEAMRYAVLGGGKRVRALLAHAAGELCGAPKEKVDIAASAVELIHAYSLVHDDMPCMDDDDLRRGKPSCHKQYDDATALLVGDALQTLAFQSLATPQLCTHANRQLEMLNLLAIASGSRGMAGGQAIDLASVGKELDQSELEYMHIHKTGALIRAAALLGAYCADDVDAERINAIDHYAQSIGLAFQVVDDILDAEADSETLGKTAGKDAESNKPTYVTILGIDRAKQLAQELLENALTPLASYGEDATRLHQLAQFITQRSF